MGRIRTRSAIALGASIVLLAACTSNPPAESPSPSPTEASPSETTDAPKEPVSFSWWHNANADPGMSFWQTIADEFTAANPHVTIDVQAIQSEDLRTRLQVALQSNDPPGLFQQWGGGELAEQVEAGLLKDITDGSDETLASLGGTVAGWSADGRVYGLPYTLGIVGFWYNKAQFAEAGIAAPPETVSELLDAVDKLKAIDVEPISVGAGDVWPAAFWYGYTALRTCGGEKVAAKDFSDPCWVRAGDLLKEIIDHEPFNRGFLATPAQTGAGSSAGLLANRNAAMELMGHWQPSVLRGLTDDEQGLGEDLGWFPFPASPNDAGTQDAVLGGGDGFSCAANAPDECADFLRYVVSPEVQARYAAEIGQLPVASGASDSLEDETLKQVAAYASASSFAQLYLDVAYGQDLGGAVNNAVAELFAGTATPQQVADTIKAAAGS